MQHSHFYRELLDNKRPTSHVPQLRAFPSNKQAGAKVMIIDADWFKIVTVESLKFVGANFRGLSIFYRLVGT